MKKGCLMAGTMKNRFYNSRDYKVVNIKERASSGFWVIIDEAFVRKGFVERYVKNGVQVVQILFLIAKKGGAGAGITVILGKEFRFAAGFTLE